MQTFKAYRIFEEGGKSAGRFVDLALDELDQGEVVIDTHYSSVNYKDALAATGAGKVIRRFPCVGGIDVSGVVASSSDARFKAGDEVLVTGYDMGVAHDGGYAEKVRVPADPINYLAVSYDHRIIDGREAVQFLSTIKEALEFPGRVLLEL